MHETLQQYLFQVAILSTGLYGAFASFKRSRHDESLKQYVRKNWVALLVLSWCYGLFFYGILFFIDGPYHPCGSEYCGKTGIHHTSAEFNALSSWEHMLFLSWPFGLMAVLFIRFRTK